MGQFHKFADAGECVRDAEPGEELHTRGKGRETRAVRFIGSAEGFVYRRGLYKNGAFGGEAEI